MKIKIHYSFLLILVIFVYSGLGYEFIILLSSIILHEFGHLITMYFFNEKPRDLFVTAFGGIINVDLKSNNSIKVFLIYISGVLVNFILINFSYLFGYYQDIVYKLNMLLLVFNLLPIYPLDGYNLLDVLFNFISNKTLKFNVLFTFSMITLTTLFIYTIIFNSLGFLILTVFLLYKNIQYFFNRNTVILKNIVKGYQISYNR